jgi:hypothetical protein
VPNAPQENQPKCQMHPQQKPFKCQMHPTPTTNPKLTHLSKYPHPNQRQPKDTPQNYTQSHTHHPSA